MSTEILVIGATGQQGSATIRHLRTGEHVEDVTLRGFTRDLTSERARALAAADVELVEGTLDDRGSVADAMAGADAVFGMTAFYEVGPETVVEHGETIATVAAETGVEHLVMSTVAGAEPDTGVPQIDSSYAIEEAVREADVPATILGPVFFMQNLATMFRADIEAGTLAIPLRDGVTLQLVDVDDVGHTAAHVFGHRQEYVGDRVEVAGDERTLEGIAAALSGHLEHDVQPVHVPMETVREGNPEMAPEMERLNEVGYNVDLAALRERTGIDYNTVEDWLERGGWTEPERPTTVEH